jgi:agmatinase
MTVFAYSSDHRFLRAPCAEASLPYAVAGIAWDGATTNRPGARFGPRAIRAASHMLCDGVHPHFDCTPAGLLGDAGDLPLPNTSLERMRAALPALVEPLIRRHHMAWLGGDHSITLPLLRAYRAWLGRPLAVLHFDAHCDTWREHFGEPSGHGTWVFEAMQEGLVVRRVLRADRHPLRRRARGARVRARPRRPDPQRARPARAGGVLPSSRRCCRRHPRERLARHGHPPLYLSLDIDAAGPRLRTRHRHARTRRAEHRPGAELLEETADLPFVGMDCVEVAPAYDHAEGLLTSAAAAAFVWTYLCGRIAARSWT